MRYIAYREFKDLETKRTAADKALNKYLILIKIQNMMYIERVLLQWFITFLIKRFLVVA